MQLEALEMFCDVVRLRSVSRAAAANGVTQSTVSQIVLRLEKELEVQLMDRSTRPLQLTAAGKVYYEGCKGLVERYRELEDSVRATGGRSAATIQVAAIYSIGLGDMGLRVEQFQRHRPGTKVQVEYLHPDRVFDKVMEGTADLGLLSYPRKARELDVVPWRDEEMVLACPPNHPLARQRSIGPAQLDGVKYVGFDKGLTIRREVDRFLREHGAAVDVALEFDNIENIKEAVRVSAGVALLPEPTLRREVEAGTLVAVPLAGAPLVRPLRIIYRHNKLSTTAQRFVDLLRDTGRFAGNGEPKSRTVRRSGPRDNGARRRHGARRANRRNA